MTPEIKQLEAQYYASNDTKQKIDLLERAIALAEQGKHLETAFELRGEMVDVGTFEGYPLKAIVAFSKRQKYADEHPEIDQWNLLWEYKWIIGNAPKFHQVEYNQIEKLLEDLKKRLIAYGDNLSAYYTMKYLTESKMGNLNEMKKYHELRHSVPEGRLNNCSVCVLDDFVEFLSLTQGFEVAKAKAKPIIEDKRSCGSVPQLTYNTLIKAALLENKLEEAEQLRKKAHRIISKDEKFYGHFGYHFILNTLRGEENKAFKLFKEKYHLTNNQANSGILHFEFFLGSTYLFKHLSNNDKQVVLPFSLDNTIQKGQQVPASLVYNFLQQKLDEWATRFDNRNKNTAFRDTMTNFLNL